MRIWFWRSRPKKALSVHGVGLKKSHQLRLGPHVLARKGMLLDRPGREYRSARRPSNSIAAMEQNVVFMRQQSALLRPTIYQHVSALGSVTNAWRGLGLQGNSQLLCSNLKMS